VGDPAITGQILGYFLILNYYFDTIIPLNYADIVGDKCFITILCFPDVVTIHTKFTGGAEMQHTIDRIIKKII
jgi:hypothetical protein